MGELQKNSRETCGMICEKTEVGSPHS